MNNSSRSSNGRTLTALARRPLSLICAVLIFILLVLWYERHPDRSYSLNVHHGHWHPADRNKLVLTHEQCDAVFPRLFAEVERAIEHRKANCITLGELDQIEPKNGYVRAMIYDHELYIIEKQGGIYSRELATLQAIYRAVTTSPQPLPNIEFVFNTDDIIFEHQPIWAYARKAEHDHIWLMPDFGFFSWPETHAGSVSEVQMQAVEREDTDHFFWRSKVDKLLWRGATMGLAVRDRLLDLTQGKEWADVIALDWHNTESMSHDLKSMIQHCDYRYLAHVEGNSYSGRLKYLQACESVIVSHEMEWIQHYYSLLSPHSGPDQNIVMIDRDFNDLEATIDYLRQNQKIAQNIARNSRRTFRDQYLTPAAEVCYWRSLIRGWAEVSFEPELHKESNGTRKMRGLPFSSFALERRLDWDPY